MSQELVRGPLINELTLLIILECKRHCNLMTHDLYLPNL
jgi:hypothetical protein